MRILIKDETTEDAFVKDCKIKLDECFSTAIDKTLDWKNRLTALQMDLAIAAPSPAMQAGLDAVSKMGGE